MAAAVRENVEKKRTEGKNERGRPSAHVTHTNGSQLIYLCWQSFVLQPPPPRPPKEAA